MKNLTEKIDGFKARCGELEAMELESLWDLLDELQDCFIDLLGSEPPKAKKAEHRLWSERLGQLKELSDRVEQREAQLYEQRFPGLKHYAALLEQPRSDEQWLKLREEIEQWLSSGSQELREEFEQCGYREQLEAICQELSRNAQPEIGADLLKYSPIPGFMKYLPLIYAVDELWESFQLFIRSQFSNEDESFFAFRRDGEAMSVWKRVVENMGDGIPLSIFAAGVYLVQRYRELGHDPDSQLAELNISSRSEKN